MEEACQKIRVPFDLPSDTGGEDVANQVQYAYNGLGQETGEYQAHAGAVDTSTTPEVQYAYSDPDNGSRMTEIIYPNGRILHYGYDNNALDNAIGRVDFVADDNGSGSAGSHLADYQYLGLSTPVVQAFGDGVDLTYLQQTGDTLTNSDGGDQYTGLDRFGRIIDQNYVTTATGTSTDRFQYAYDADGNVLYKDNLLESSDSELYHASSSASGDDATAYDALNRLTGFERGTLSASGNNGSTLDSVSSPSQSESYSYDALGNMTSTTTNSTTTDRTTNSQNELTSVGTATLNYDNDGDTTLDDQGHTLVYDAWSRLVAVRDSSGDAVETYGYDGTGRQITDSIGGDESVSVTDVKDIDDGGGYTIQDLTNVDGTLFFIANDGTHGYQLWKSDGTSSGTVMLSDINPGGTAGIANLTAVGATLFFTAADGTHGTELWKSDGTSGGTTLVKDIDSGSASSTPTDLTAVGDELYFSATDGSDGVELWKSDGTSTGTTMVKDIDSGSASSSPQYLTDADGELFFVADDGTHGAELWKSDGTSAGTTLVKDIESGSSTSYASYLTSINGEVFFLAHTGADGWQLYKSDGTSSGTVELSDFSPSANGSTNPDMTNVNGELFFYANDGTHGWQIWKSDGTTGGTVQVSDLNVSGGGIEIFDPINFNGDLFFAANDGSDGWQMWKTDGTTSGTVQLSDWGAYDNGGAVPYATEINGALVFFVANDGTHGYELWETDGTSAGTIMADDIDPGSGNGGGQYYTAVGGTLYLVANQTQLYKVVPSLTTTDLYYSNQSQVLEARQDGTVTDQYVWSPFYVNDLILRDDNSTGGNLGISGSGLGERLYAQNDANYNVTALVNTSGTVMERFLYDPYGNATVLAANWSASTATAGNDSYKWGILFQGERYDVVAGVYVADERVYSPTMDRWLQEDPAGYIDGLDKYITDQSNPLLYEDPLGLKARIVRKDMTSQAQAENANGGSTSVEPDSGRIIFKLKCDNNGKWTVDSIDSDYTITVYIATIAQLRQIYKKQNENLTDEQLAGKRETIINYEMTRNAEREKTYWDGETPSAEVQLIYTAKPDTEDNLKNKINSYVDDIWFKTFAEDLRSLAGDDKKANGNQNVAAAATDLAELKKRVTVEIDDGSSTTAPAK